MADVDSERAAVPRRHGRTVRAAGRDGSDNGAKAKLPGQANWFEGQRIDLGVRDARDLPTIESGSADASHRYAYDAKGSLANEPDRPREGHMTDIMSRHAPAASGSGLAT
jgi:hypothetical protein